MASFRPDWLWLYEAVPMLEARGLTRERAQLQLLRAVQAGRISRVDPGSGPLLRFPDRPPINISGARPAIATGQADLSASTVTVPCQVKGKQDQFSAVEIGRLKSLLDGDAFARFLRLLDVDRTEIMLLPVAVQILADDVDRLWPDPAGTSPPPTPSKPPANDNPAAAVRTNANEKAEKDCISWLQKYVADGGKRLTKGEAFALAKGQPWGGKVSGTGFDERVWPAAAPADWRTGGRPRKPPG